MPDESDVSSTSDDVPAYVNTPYGMVTAEGRWYHIPEEDVRDYAGEVLDHVSLEQLLQWADAWRRSSRTATLWTLPALLWILPSRWAAPCALVLFIVWALGSPALPTVAGAKVGRVLDHGLVQALYYVIVLSVFAALEQYLAVLVGLGAFVLFRWGVVQWALRPVLRPLWRRLYPLPVTDQVLRGLIVRVALKYRLAVPHVEAITSDIIDNWGARTGSSPASADESESDAE